MTEQRRQGYGNTDTLDDLDFEMPPGCVLAQLGGLAGVAAYYYDRYESLRRKHWPAVLAWNLAIGAVATSARRVPAPIAKLDNPGYSYIPDASERGGYRVCALCEAIEDGNASCWACVDRWEWAKGRPWHDALLATLRDREPALPVGADEVSAFIERIRGSLPHRRPYKPDQMRVDRGAYLRVSGDVLCSYCKLPLYDHPDVRGYDGLRRRCDGMLVKL